MTNPVDAAIAVSRRAMKAIAGRTVTYRRGEDDEIENVVAVPGLTRAESSESEDITLDVTIRDYLIDAADIDFGDGPVEPEEDDVIQEVDGTIFAVASLGNEPCWRWSDPARTIRRIHTRLDSEGDE